MSKHSKLNDVSVPLELRYYLTDNGTFGLYTEISSDAALGVIGGRLVDSGTILVNVVLPVALRARIAQYKQKDDENGVQS